MDEQLLKYTSVQLKDYIKEYLPTTRGYKKLPKPRLVSIILSDDSFDMERLPTLETKKVKEVIPDLVIEVQEDGRPFLLIFE